jgi:hypothetical protein
MTDPCTFTIKEKLVLPVLSLASFAVTVYSDSRFGSTGAPSNGIYTKIYSTGGAFAALKTDGSIKAWGAHRH